MSAELSATARRHIRLLGADLQPKVALLACRFETVLKRQRSSVDVRRALLAISPLAASHARSVARFLEEVEYQGRRLAKLNTPLEDVLATLGAFDEVVGRALRGSHEPAREKIRLITAHALREAYYQVREAETQVFYGLAHAEAESVGLEQLLSRIVRILVKAFHARSGELVLEPGREQYVEGPPAKWIFPVRETARIELTFDKPYPWLPREHTMMQAVADRVAQAIERVQLSHQARHAEEQERRRIGRELHDDTAQSLLLLRLQLEMLERHAPDGMREQLAQSRDIAGRAIEDLRRTIAALSPAVLDRLGLEPALRHLVARFRKSHPANVEVRITPECGRLAPAAREVVYRVAQESLQNIHKHSQANRINLSLTSTDKRLRLSVRDNGAGFREPAAAKPMSFGLAGMRERAALLGGTLAIRGVPGRGTIVTLDLPGAFADAV